MVRVSSRTFDGDRRPLSVDTVASESGDDTDWDETEVGVHAASAITYDNTSSGLTADDVQEAIDELAAGITANAELNIEGGQSVIGPHGAAGATEDIDPTDGNVHTITLDDDLTATILQPVGSGAATLELWVTQDGTGGHDLTIAASGGSVTGDISGHTTTAGETFRVIAERIPGTTNDWIVDLVGGSGGVGTPASTVEDETTFGISPAVGTDTEYARQDHTHGTPSLGTTSTTAAAGNHTHAGIHGAILLESGHSVPFTFDEILQESDGSDFLYASG